MKVRLPDKDTTGIDLTRTDYIELRDYFAAKAMQALLNGKYCNDSWKEFKTSVISAKAYSIADQMLEARKQ